MEHVRATAKLLLLTLVQLLLLLGIMLVYRPVNLIYTHTKRRLEVHGMTVKHNGEAGRKCDTGLIIS